MIRMKSVVFIPILLGVIHSANAQVLATVGNTKITAEDFNRRMEQLRKESPVVPPADQFLEDLIRFEIGVQEAEKMKMQDDPIVKDRFKQVLYKSFLERQFSDRMESIKISEKDLKEYYKKNPELRLAHSLVEFEKPGDREGAKKRATELVESLKKNKKAADEMADIGFQSRATMTVVLYEAAAALKPEEIKGPIESKVGFHVLRLIEKRPFDLADKQLLRAALLDERRAKIFDEYFDKTKKSYKVEINKEALKSTVK